MIKEKELLKRDVRSLKTETNENFPHNLLVDRSDVLYLIDQLEEPEITEEQAWNFISEKYGSENLVKLHKKYLEREGYVVEKKERLYTACFKVENDLIPRALFLYKSGGFVYVGDNAMEFDEDNKRCQLTEKEIKDYDEKFWQFAVPVEEKDSEEWLTAEKAVRNVESFFQGAEW